MKKLLTDGLNKNQYLKRLELQQIKDMVECMYERTYLQGEYVVKQGEPGNHLFVLAGRSTAVRSSHSHLTLARCWWKEVLYFKSRLSALICQLRHYILKAPVYSGLFILFVFFIFLQSVSHVFLRAAIHAVLHPLNN